MNDRKYPTELFIIGFLMNIVFHFFWLFLLAILFLIIGIFDESCLYIGIIILCLDIALSFIEQLRIRQAFLEESDNPDFRAFQDALSKDGNWRDNLNDFLNEKMSDPENHIESDDENENN